MQSEFTNLLPLERQRLLARDYFFRLGVVGVILVNMLVLIAAILLFPTYLFLTKSMNAKETHLAALASGLSLADETALSARLAALANEATILSTLGDAPSVSAILRDTLNVMHPGITLSGFIYSPSAESTLTISGTAATRAALRNYQLALQSAPFARSAALPVSAYAKDTDIAFNIVVTLAP